MDLKSKQKTETGSALISVLCFIALAALLAASAVSLSVLANQSSAVFTDRTKAAYLAEGAATRTMWLLMNDKSQNTDRNMGTFDYSKIIGERYMADGCVHKIDYYECPAEASIYDMANGIEVSVSKITSLFTDKSKPRTLVENEDLKSFTNKLEDYVDADDFIKANGFEKQDYVAIGMPTLPRNAPMKFKEEILYIPGFEDFFQLNENGRLDIFRAIPPKGLPQLQGLSSFYSADRFLIQTLCKLSDEKTDLIIEAQKRWHETGQPLSEQLTPDLLSSLNGKFSFRESGFYTLSIRAASTEGAYGRTLVLSLKVDTQFNYNIIPYYEWILY